MKMGLFRATIFSMKALYRKYRPLHLSEVIGQDKTIEQLQGALTKGKISHAYLFVGPLLSLASTISANFVKKL